MAFASASSSFNGNVPLRFYQVKHPDETTEHIAAKFNVDIQKILQDNPGIEAYSGQKIPVGEMLVISLKA